MNMKRWSGFSGILGLVILLFGLMGGFFVDFKLPLMAFHLLFGLLLIVYWVITVGFKNITQAPKVLTGRTSRFSLNLVIYSAVFLALLICINWIGNRPNNIKRWDLTEQNEHSLSEQSINLVQGLKEPLRIIGFIGKDTGTQYHELLKLYRFASDKVTVEFVDPNSKPHLIDKYKMKEGNLVYLGYGAKEDNLLGESRVNDIKEESVTNAILKLTRGAAKKVYYVIGHDEPALKDENKFGVKMLADAIDDEHLNIEEIYLAQTGAVPADAAALLLISPKKPLIESERDLIKKYVDGGGRLIMMSDPLFPAQSNDVKELAAYYGITVGEDMVLDQVQRLFAGPAIGAQPLVREYGSHPITKGLGAEQPTIFNMASSVSVKDKSGEGITRTELVKSSPTSWAETGLAALLNQDNPSAALDDKDIRGPISLAASYEKGIKPAGAKPEDKDTPPENYSRVVVFGDSDWVLNANFHVAFNRDLMLNALNWTVGEDASIAIRPKTSRLQFDGIDQETYLTLLGSSFVVPELILLAGLSIWWRRKTVMA